MTDTKAPERIWLHPDYDWPFFEDPVWKKEEGVEYARADLDRAAVAVAILGLCEARGDMTGEALEELANEIGRMGHMRGRMVA